MLNKKVKITLFLFCFVFEAEWRYSSKSKSFETIILIKVNSRVEDSGRLIQQVYTEVEEQIQAVKKLLQLSGMGLRACSYTVAMGIERRDGIQGIFKGRLAGLCTTGNRWKERTFEVMQ